MNKYHEALNTITSYMPKDYDFTRYREKEANDEAVSYLRVLIANYRDCRNELCQYCGKYKEEHLGACDGCRWHND